MYFRLTRYKGDAARRAEALKWLDERKAEMQALGATQLHLVEFGEGDYAMAAMYPDAATAQAAASAAAGNFKAAAEAGLLDPATIQRSEGEVIRTLVG